MNPKISAIICTHNRQAYIEAAIESLIAQKFPRDAFEIMIVNNGSTDQTAEKIKKYKNIKNLHCFYEPILGHSQSRNVGLQKSQGQYVAYMDDDAIADPLWLSNIVNAFETVNPRPGCVGGRVEAIWEEARPDWLVDEMVVQLSVMDISSEPIFDQHLLGNNIAFPRDLLLSMGGFNTKTGRKGKNLLSGDESLVQSILTKLGYRSYYHPDILVHHCIQKERLKKDWFLNRYYWGGVTSVVIETHHGHYDKEFARFRIILFRFRQIVKQFFLWLFNSKNRKAFYYRCVFYSILGNVVMLFKDSVGLKLRP